MILQTNRDKKKIENHNINLIHCRDGVIDLITNNILINTETRNVKNRDYDFLGIAGENNIEQIVFKLSAFIDGEAILEIEKYNKDNQLDKYFIALEKQEDSYIFEVKSSLLDVAKSIRMQLHITTENEEVFKSKIFTMNVYEEIKATETVPEQYQEWIDTANAVLARIKSLEETMQSNEKERAEAETERNKKVDDAISKIEDLRAEYNENAKDKIKEYDDNTVKKTTEYNELAKQKEAELDDIAEVVRDLASAMQYASFRVNTENMQVQIKQPGKMSNARFRVEKGNLEVKVI